MSTLQAWLVVGIPGLALTAGLFAGRSVIRARVGYGVLALTFVFFLLVNSSVSAALIGAAGFLLVAAGRGQTDIESEPYGHEVPARVGDPDREDSRRL